MKTLIVWTIALGLALSGCKKGDDTPVTPVTPAKPDYQTAIEAKYKSLGWTQGADNGGVPQQTAGKKGYVQYYGSKDRAIYYYPADGVYAGGAFGVLNLIIAKYDGLAMESFAGSGRLTSDEIVVNGLFHYAETEFGLITNEGRVVYGEIYKEYKRLNRWDGPLSFPISDEVDLTSKKGRYNAFKNGQIYWSNATGAHAFWGRVEKLYAPTGYDTGWLGLPSSSCDPTIADTKQLVRFQNGVINAATCGSYQNSVGETVYQNGTRAANVSSIPCYNP